MVDLEIGGNRVVTLRYHPPYVDEDERSYLDLLKKLPAIEEPYVLLSILGGGPPLSPAGEREQSLWFKQYAGKVEQHCRALAIVRPNATQKMAEAFRKLWDFPVMVTTDEREARKFLETIAGRPL